MAHNHSHNHSHNHDAEKNISTVFFLNALFVIVEIIGGLLTNSIAILTDALHDFGDCLSLALAWAFQKKSKQKRDKKYSYGYKRFALLSVIFLSGMLLLSSLIVIFEAAKRVINPQDVNVQGMVWIAVFGVVINGAAIFKIKKGKTLSERAVFLHLMEDVLGWVAVLIVSIVMLFVYFPALDSILSIGISVWVLINVYKNMRRTFKILFQATPEDLDIDKLKQELESVESVKSVHDLHVWSLDGETHVMTLHTVIPDNKVDTNRIKQSIIDIAKNYHIGHVTIEIENADAECLHNCEK